MSYTIPMSYPMAGGDGEHSYSQNSNFQRGIVQAAKLLVNSAIEDMLEFSYSSGTCNNTFVIADFGCSTGSNTLIATQNIIEAVKHKYHSQYPNHPLLEFQLFFNDHVNNDFNTLFRNFPPSREFFAAGVPGSFYNRLFPKASLHLGHSSSALHWLSKVPDEVIDVNSPAWNKDSIYCSGVSKEVTKAYVAQFQNDMERFLNARGQEVASGGLLLLTVAGHTERTISSQTYGSMMYDILGSCLAEMVEERGVVEAAKVFVNSAIEDILEFSSNSSGTCNSTFVIADFGCSTGSNTLIATRNIIEAVKQKYQSQYLNHPPLEFQVLFNDHVNNDFNTLFRNFPPSQEFFGAGVPGSFHDQLFPKASLHLGHSSCALHWLSKVPDEVLDVNSPAWNKDSVYCSRLSKEVTKAYTAQFQNDVERFLNARAQEVVEGGLLVLTIAGDTERTISSQTHGSSVLKDSLGSCLKDMAQEGLIAQEKVEAFNIPTFNPTIQEMEAVLQRNEYFSVERIESSLAADTVPLIGPALLKPLSKLMRATFGELVREHFGDDIVDSVFERYPKKLSENLHALKDKQKNLNIFVGSITEREMASKETIVISYPMAGGEGEHSYSQNSNFQRGIVEAAKLLVNSAVEDMLEFSYSSGSCNNTFVIADFGCSTGSNTLIATQNIIEAVKHKYHSQYPNHPPLEFQIFFNDHVNNDFNTLFRSFPPSREFFAAGVPGSFYNRLFPKASLHLGHSSSALHWFSKVPDEVMDVNSPAWNKDSIYCSGVSKEVTKAYVAQFQNDMERFLNARAQEVVAGGLLVLTVAGETERIISSQTYGSLIYDILGSCLADMAKEGLISEEKLEAFNIPTYNPTIQDIEAVLQRNAYFSIERISSLTSDPKPSISPSIVQPLSKLMRAAFEELIRQHFGEDIVDSVFEHYPKKLSENLHKYRDKQRNLNIFIVLKRNSCKA
ncbi:hypothetical protein Tsubulata_022991 [Turnera subulata]|uniref:Uncharacterized protein n=1 Tax=Turnera subulata TaxID=218843 RepID=A0A9Q0JRU0_9ROSI|nr:hypothetical protein Tsubulata_022991 [Turnera subulata]